MTPRESIKILEDRMNESVLGQEHVISRLIMGLLADGNILVEGLSGLAKTRAIRAMADAIDGKFSRIQFTPDLLPSDVTGSERLYEENGKCPPAGIPSSGHLRPILNNPFFPTKGIKFKETGKGNFIHFQTHV